MLQERLNKQQEDNDTERQRLQDLIARLESQIREQTRMLEDVSKPKTCFEFDCSNHINQM